MYCRSFPSALVLAGALSFGLGFAACGAGPGAPPPHPPSPQPADAAPPPVPPVEPDAGSAPAPPPPPSPPPPADGPVASDAAAGAPDLRPGGADAGAGLGCAVDPQRIFADVRHLASPELRGRKPGDPGNELAVQFTEKQFAAAGLAPAGRRAAASARPSVPRRRHHPQRGRGARGQRLHAGQAGGHRRRATSITWASTATARSTTAPTTTPRARRMVMELARLFKLCGVRPKRTMLFVEWNAEEMGLIGSRAYVANAASFRWPTPSPSTTSTWSARATAAARWSSAATTTRNAWMTELLRAATAAAKLPHVIQIVPQKLASDHAPFVEKGVPSLFAFLPPRSPPRLSHPGRRHRQHPPLPPSASCSGPPCARWPWATRTPWSSYSHRSREGRPTSAPASRPSPAGCDHDGADAELSDPGDDAPRPVSATVTARGLTGLEGPGLPAAWAFGVTRRR